MDNYPTLESLATRLDDLSSRRHELGQPHQEELKPFEEPINYILGTLDAEDQYSDILDSNDYSSFFDPVHALELYQRVVGDDVDEYPPIDQILGDGEYTWEDALEDVREGFEPSFDFPNRGDIRRNPKEALNEIDKEELTSTPDLDKDTMIEKFSEKQSGYREWPENLDASEALRELYKNGIRSITREHLKMRHLRNAAEQKKGGIHHKSEEDLEDFSTPFGRESMHFNDEHRHPEAYEDLEPSLPDVHPALPYEMASYFLDQYESRLEDVESHMADQGEAEYEVVEVEKTDEELRVNWSEFADLPEPEKDLLDTAARFQRDTGIDVDAEFLGKVVADKNSAEVDYRDDEIAANRTSDTTIGDLKDAVEEVDNLDFVLPVMSKERELQRLSGLADQAEELLERREFTYTEKERRKVS
jgi:hypothetical protein